MVCMLDVGYSSCSLR